MDIWEQTNWYVVHAKAYRENLAAASVGALDVEVFLPRVKRDQMVGGIWRAVARPLFPGYFFARFCPNLLLDAIRRARGVLSVLGTSRVPVPLADEVICEIHNRTRPDGFIRLESRPFRPGDRVAIEQGPLAGWIGRVEREWDDRRRVSILLETVQQSRVLVEKRSLSLLPQQD
jgi:transcriptional antiterminator RfaH